MDGDQQAMAGVVKEGTRISEALLQWVKNESCEEMVIGIRFDFFIDYKNFGKNGSLYYKNAPVARIASPDANIGGTSKGSPDNNSKSNTTKQGRKNANANKSNTNTDDPNFSDTMDIDYSAMSSRKADTDHPDGDAKSDQK